MDELVFMRLGMNIMAPESISRVYFINPSQQSVCLCVYSPLEARQWLGKNPYIIDRQTAQQKCYCGNEYTYSNTRISGCIIFYAVRVISRKVGS
jgi:hypothetical protein